MKKRKSSKVGKLLGILIVLLTLAVGAQSYEIYRLKHDNDILYSRTEILKNAVNEQGAVVNALAEDYVKRKQTF